MHELGIVSGVLDSVRPVAQEAGATRLLSVTLKVGEMTGALQDAMNFAWEALSEGDPFLEGAQLRIITVHPHSRCLECAVIDDVYHLIEGKAVKQFVPFSIVVGY